MGNITYINVWLLAKSDREVDTDETEGVRIIRENMKLWGSRKKRVDALIKEKNDRSIERAKKLDDLIN